MHRYPHRPKIAHAEDTADDIAAQVIEYQDLPDGFAFGRQDRRRRGDCAVRMWFVGLAGVDRLVQIEYLLDGGFVKS